MSTPESREPVPHEPAEPVDPAELIDPVDPAKLVDPAEAAQPVAVPPELPWQHFHPLTPVLRGGVMITAVLGYWLSTQANSIFGGRRDDPTGGHLGWAAIAFAVVLAGVLAIGWISWRKSEYRLGHSTAELRQGVVMRQHRQVRYDRIQAVDITRPLLARLAGLSSVKVEAAGGRDSNIELSYLPEARANEVRGELLRRAALALGSAPPRPGAEHYLGERDAGRAAEGDGSQAAGAPAPGDRAPGDGVPGARAPDDRAPGDRAPGDWVPGDLAPWAPVGSAPGEQELPVARIPASRVWAATLLSFNTAFLILAIPALLVALVTGSIFVLPWLGPMVLGALGQQVSRFTTWMNFRVDASPSVIRIRHGLTELRTTTVPLHRIQAVEISQPWLWRAMDWWRIEVNVAGVQREQDKGGDALIPVGTRAEALAILAAMGPRWSLPEVIEGMDAPGPSPSFVGVPRSARWLDALSWRRIGFAVTPAAFVSRGGRLGRRVQLVPHARVQSLTLDQGPIERLLGLANVRLRSTPGPVGPMVRHLTVADATRLLNVEAACCAQARHQESSGPVPPERSSS